MTHIKKRLYTIIFEADTRAGKAFDVCLLLVALSAVIICLSSVEAIYARYQPVLRIFSWCFTLLFSIEYILQIFCSARPLKYVFSFFGIIAVPTGILSAEIAGTVRTAKKPCPACGKAFHEQAALFCNRCGGKLAAD